MSKTVVLATNGTLGDLLPFLALAGALTEAGMKPVVATSGDLAGHARAAGFETRAIFPGIPDFAARRGETVPEFIVKFIQRPIVLFDRVIDWAEDSSRAFAENFADADLVVANHLAIGAHLGSEMTERPLVTAIFQPIGLTFWQLMDRDRVRAIRAALNLPRRNRTDNFDFSPWMRMILAMYSPLMGRNVPQLPWPMHITGAPEWSDPDGPDLDPETLRFLDAGPPPLVFTLGSYLPQLYRHLYEAAVPVSRALGRRAILVGAAGKVEPAPDIHVCGFAPHGPLFARAGAVIHHGGIGTAFAAMRAGRPQLVVPHMSDAGNNAERIERLGISATLLAPEFNAGTAGPRLGHLLEDAHVRKRTRHVAMKIGQEDGARAAAGKLLEIL